MRPDGQRKPGGETDGDGQGTGSGEDDPEHGGVALSHAPDV